MAKKKSVAQKIVDAVDQVIHPDAQKPAGECPVTDATCEKNCAPEECKATVSQEVAEKMVDSGAAEIPAESVVEKPAGPKKKSQQSSKEKSDYASHPKFAKFKSSQGAE